MIQLQWGVIAATGLVPLLIGAVWFGPLFGQRWARVTGVTEEQQKNASMVKIFSLTLLSGLFIAVGITPLVIHQMGVFSALQNAGVATPGTDAWQLAQNFMAQYGTEFRTLSHGAIHGFMAGLFITTPVQLVNALFERRSVAYILLNTAYWTLCTTVMGALICAYA